MPRTQQTSRRSTGGRAPRKQLATRPAIRRAPYIDRDDDENDNKNDFAGLPQVDMFTTNGTRTIVVEGSAEFQEIPDRVNISFLISETSNTIEFGIQKVLQKINQVRTICCNDCGLPNSQINSDSIGSKGIKTEYGYWKRHKGQYGDDEDESTFHVKKTEIIYEVKSVLRISLEVGAGGDDEEEEGEGGDETGSSNNISELFSKVLYMIMSKVGLRTHGAPKYDLTKLTRYRNEARQSACDNAKEKAICILDALDDPTIQLGRPICITDIFCDNQDDAYTSFTGNSISWTTNRQILDNEDDDEDDDAKEEEGKDTTKNNVDSGDDDDDKTEMEPKSKKRARLSKGQEESSKTLTEATAEELQVLNESMALQMFVVPPITIVARIRAVFEIASVDAVETNDKENDGNDMQEEEPEN